MPHEMSGRERIFEVVTLALESGTSKQAAYEAFSNALHSWRLRDMGRRGGKAGGSKGGTNRMAGLTPEERSALATKASQARWSRNQTVERAPKVSNKKDGL